MQVLPLVGALLALALPLALGHVDFSSSQDLAAKKCQPCEGGMVPFSHEEALSQLRELEGWELRADESVLSIERAWKVKDFKVALDFFAIIGKVADEEGHHPDLALTGYRNVRVRLFTHAIGGLSINDFILAAKINQISVVLKSSSASATSSAATATSSATSSPVSKHDDVGDKKRQAVVHMLSGMIGSGKSTYSAQLVERYKAIVFSPDEWILKLYGKDFPIERFQEVGDSVKEMIWGVVVQLVQAGHHVVLDFSLWIKTDRDFWAGRIQKAGFKPQLYFFRCDAATLRSRLALRNGRVQEGQETHFVISLETFNGWLGLLEPPAEDEPHILVDSCGKA